jgi:hypothetical protein
MMRKRRTNESRILFPWEQQGNIVRRLGFRRVRPVVFVSILASAVILVVVRERRDSGVRRTRATLSSVSYAVNRYLADNQGRCPATFGELGRYYGAGTTPVDAWGNSLRLTCPAPRGDLPYLLSSDGPDGRAGGLDRIE